MSDPDPVAELPELMLSLRSIGSRRGMSNEGLALTGEQDRFFAPLLDGRRMAAQAISRPQVVAAFDSRRLTAVILATLRELAAERFATRAPARRAFEAELLEMVEPLRDALQVLGRLAEPIPLGQTSPVSEELWTIWLAQLRVVFHVADSSWPALRGVLAASPRPTSGGGRWPFASPGDGQR